MASLQIGLSNTLVPGNKQIEKQVQTKSQTYFNKPKLPRVSNRLLFFQKNKPKIIFATQFKSIGNNDNISESEIILWKRDYEFLHTEPNDMINPNPHIKKSLKVHHKNINNEPAKTKETLFYSNIVSYIDTNPFYIHKMPNQNKISTTLYTVLTKQKQEL